MPRGSETGRFEELKDLFGPTFGPALEAYGRSLAERLLEDEGFQEEIRGRFEKGRARGRLPALSEHLAGWTHEEIEEFFSTGWVNVASISVTLDIYSHLLPDMQEKATKALEEALK
jgi:hypothetical protein